MVKTKKRSDRSAFVIWVGYSQSRITLPDMPLRITSKSCWKSSILQWWVICHHSSRKEIRYSRRLKRSFTKWWIHNFRGRSMRQSYLWMVANEESECWWDCRSHQASEQNHWESQCKFKTIWDERLVSCVIGDALIAPKLNLYQSEHIAYFALPQISLNTPAQLVLLNDESR